MKHLVEILLSLKAETPVWNAISKKRWISSDTKNYVEHEPTSYHNSDVFTIPTQKFDTFIIDPDSPERQKMKHTQSIKLDSIGRSDMQQFNYHGNSLNLSHAEPPYEKRFIANVKDQPIHFLMVIGAKSAFDFHKKWNVLTWDWLKVISWKLIFRSFAKRADVASLRGTFH